MPNLTPEQQAAAQAYRDCLTANGVTIPQRGNRAPGGSQPAAGDQATGAAPATGGQPVDPNAPAGGGTNTPRVNLDPAAMTKAQEACKDKLPADGTGAIFGGFGGQGGANGQGAGGQGGAARQTALVPYYACLKDNGITVADASVAGQAPVTTQPGAAPAAGQAGGQPGQGFTRGGRLAGVDQTSPEFTAANEKCKVLIPEGMTINGGGGPGGPPPGGDMATAPTTTVG